MRKTLLAVLMASTAGAAVADEGYYTGLQLGLTSQNDLRIDPNDNLTLLSEHDLGPMAGAFIGIERDKWRWELEYAFRRVSVGELRDQGPGSFGFTGNRGAGGDLQSDAFMVNAFYNLFEQDSWKVLLGGGIGIARLDVENVFTSLGTAVNGDDWQPAGQGILQVAKQLDENIELGLGYRYFFTRQGDFDTAAGPADFRFENHEVFARFTLHFGRKSSGGIKPATEPQPVPPAPKPEPKPEPKPAPVAKPAPAPQPAPKPEPKPVPLPGPFLVFFDFDSADVTSSAAGIIREAARVFGEFDVVRIQTTGHTDRAGSNSYNEKLALRRAEAVKNALIARGVPAAKISIRSEGEDNPLVATADDVREAQNRRVEIVLER